MRNPILFCGLVFVCAVSARAADDAWVKVQTPHFLVLSNGSQKDARDVALGFEQIHVVFATTFPNLRTDASAQTIVMAVKDVRTYAELMPEEKKIADHLGGQFLKGWEKDYVIVRLDLGVQTREAVYHEYIHKLLHLNFTRLPVWLDEGLAEFYGNTEVRKDQTIIGAPSPRINLLHSQSPYPLETLLSVDRRSPYYNDAIKAPMFYAESWGLTHYLTVGAGMDAGAKMSSYLVALQKGADSKKAFEQTFGNFKDVEKQFDSYIAHVAFPAFALNKPLDIDQSAFTGGTMTPAERDARMGGFFTQFRNSNAAEGKLSAALAADPQSAMAHENLAFLRFQQGKDEEAKREFDKAVSLDPKSYLATYYQAMMTYGGKSDSESLGKLDDAMHSVLDLNPRFAPALVERAQILVSEQKLQEAFNTAVQAERLEPDRAGYFTNMAAILLLGHNYSEAERVASAVAARWGGPDSAEALAVLDEARRLGGVQPTADEKAQEAEEMKYAEGLSAVNGVIQSVECDKERPKQVVIQSGDKSVTFQFVKQWGQGFSDTLWFGEDHFNTCYHLDGMNAVVRYKAGTDGASPPEVRWLEIRDQLIPVVNDVRTSALHE